MEVPLVFLQDSVQPIVARGIANAKAHDINVHHGVQNLASGDCALECMIDGISTRECFHEVLDGTPDFWRRKWFTEAENLAYAFYNAGMTEEDWRAEWNVLKESGQYEYNLGDLILPVIAHCTEKDILIFNTSLAAHAPIFVVEASLLSGRKANTEIPVILAYDQSHYESLVPDTDMDIEKSIELKRSFVDGKYSRIISDIPALMAHGTTVEKSYAKVVQENGGDKGGSEKLENVLFSAVETNRNRQPGDIVDKSVKNTDSVKGHGVLKSRFKIKNKNMAVPGSSKHNENSKERCNDKHKQVKERLKGRIDSEDNAKSKAKSSSPPKKRYKGLENELSLYNRFDSLSDIQTEDEDVCVLDLEALKSIKKKERTDEQQARYCFLMKLQRNEKKKISMSRLREGRTSNEKAINQKKNTEAKARSRAQRTTEEKIAANKKNAEAMAWSRAGRTPEKKREENTRAAGAKARSRAGKSLEEKKAENKSNAEAKARSRAGRSLEVKKAENKSNAEAKARSREGKSLGEKKAENKRNAEAMARSRAKETSAEEKKRKEKDRKQKEKKRTITKSMPSSMYSARNAQKILYGDQIVHDLDESDESIGQMNHKCLECGALKWKNETATLCCNNGKVNLEPFPEPPPYLRKLWTEDNAESRLFREQSRPFNNALALSSIKVEERKFDNNFSPSVIFEGKVSQIYGPLIPGPNETPRFSQLYVHDPATEHTIRIANMNLPKSLTSKQVLMIKKVMENLQKLMKEVNPYVKDFIHICEIPDEDLKEGKLVISCKNRPKGAHERTYNKQTSLSEVSILTNSEPGDIVLRKREGGLQFVYDIHPAAQALHFTVLFPYGTDGYNEQTKHAKGDTKRRVTPREFFSYHLNMRYPTSDFIFRAGRLFQEYICMGFKIVESQKLKYQRNNQKALRADTYKNVKEVVSERMPMTDKVYNDDHNLKLGKRIVLSSSFVGSPRWYNSQFQDGMAICREYHKPDFFITMTCNQHWREITRELRNGENVQDRPDLVARVFKLKKDQLIKDINAGKVLGKVPALLWVIEFQKRGLPHAHILVILTNDDRLTSSADVDNVICAELPQDPEQFPLDTPERKQAERLEAIVLKNMVHGPCGKVNTDSPCMTDGVCSKKYPKQFCERTNIDPAKTHPEYQRQSPEKGGRTIVMNIKGKDYVIDNTWIVPYSPFLCLRFNCHINVELCQSPTATKYLYKYVYKGADRAMVRVEIEDATKDEIGDFEDLRSIGSSEAAWQIFNFNITKKHPAVYALRCHLENEQSVVFDEETASTDIENQKNTELTGFFDYNKKNPETHTMYIDFPKKFVWKEREWKVRKAAFDTIGRVHAMNPAAGDVFYLRMLLHHEHCAGKVSFEDLKTVDGEVKETYQEVCRLLGLLQDDKEWDNVLIEGSMTKMSMALRELFITILLFCVPANPKSLFDSHYLEWGDDFLQTAEKKGRSLTDNQLKTLVLMDIKHRLQSWERDLNSFGLHEPSEDELEDVNFKVEKDIPAVIREELNFNMEDLRKLVGERVSQFTESQKEVYTLAMEAVENQNRLCLFIDARGGTGKTFVMNTILSAVRLLDGENGGSVALAVGTTGIAANLLHLGRTFHSRFKAPLNPSQDSVLAINSQSNLAELIRLSKIIVVDEAPMLHRYLLEALDRTLRDITDTDIPFGGKILILSGDFRQTLPVLKNSSSEAVIEAALNRSHLWKEFTVVQLKENMRIKASGDPVLEEFDNWTVSIGNGEAEQEDGTDMIKIPSEMCFRIQEKSPGNPDSEKEAMTFLANHVYPRLGQNILIPGWINGRSILAPTNNQVDAINNLISESFPGKPYVLTSSDELQNQNDLSRFNIEYLNSLSPSGLPTHRLFLKVGMPLMLLRNLNPKMGLCNGTRLIFEKVHSNNLLECSITGGEFNSRKVLIPRITLKPKDGEFAFDWSRRQFPVRVCFAMTINKSQGQTLQNIGVWLNDSCFAHGQLYVAVSRVGSPSKVKFAIRQTHGAPESATRNVVHREVFRNLF